MRTFEILRNRVFWILDWVKGGPVRNHYKEIKFILENPGSTKAASLKKQYLSDLLMHSVENCSYYHGLEGYKNLSNFPVVNKTIIKDNQNDFKAKNNLNEKLIAVTTSGSTGTPFKTLQNATKKNRNYADTIYFAKLAGYQLGHHLIYFKIWVKENMHSRLFYLLQNIEPIDVVHLSEYEIESIILRMNKKKETYSIIGYPSALEQVAKYLEKYPKLYEGKSVHSIITMSESLNNYTKITLEKHFKTNVVSRYSNLENGIIAQQLNNSKGSFLINTASYIVEVLKMNTDEPVENGETGRIVITDLFNYAMPMIRYDTGDIGVIKSGDSGDKRLYLERVEGRKLDMLFDTKGNLLSSFIWFKNMCQYTEIDQFQLIQEDKSRYIFKINSKGEFSKEEKLIKEFKSFLGDDADFKVEYVSEIPLLASGKRRQVVNNYIN